jgi:hypothetical protein
MQVKPAPDNESRMLDLIHSFPSFSTRVVVDRWDASFISDPDGLPAIYDQLPHDAQLVIEFALAVWNDTTDWTEYGFRSWSPRRAAPGWDDGHWRAFLGWVKDPVMP